MTRNIVFGLAGAFAALVAGFVTPAGAQTPLFSDESEIAITIEAPFNSLVRTAARSTDPVPATLTLTNGAGAPQTFQIQVAPRGVTRRNPDVCSFPPLQLDFDGDAVAGTLFEGQNKVKLVTHCRSTPSHEQFVVLEYDVYRLYNLLTPVSFRVRPVRITYRDSERHRDDTRFAFLIEDVDDLAARNGFEEYDIEGISADALEPETAARFALFQYMISNLDWSFRRGETGATECCHNSKLLVRPGSTTPVTPVPYDFDYSGLVGAPYAVPPEGFGEEVRTRHYIGLCRHNDQLPAVRAAFQAQRANIDAVFTGDARLGEYRRTQVVRYLDAFFEMLDDQAAFDRAITNSCRG